MENTKISTETKLQRMKVQIMDAKDAMEGDSYCTDPQDAKLEVSHTYVLTNKTDSGFIVKSPQGRRRITTEQLAMIMNSGVKLFGMREVEIDAETAKKQPNKKSKSKSRPQKGNALDAIMQNDQNTAAEITDAQNTLTKENKVAESVV